MADKAGATMDRVEVETSQLIFKGLFTTGEELIATVIPIFDMLPRAIRRLVSKDSVLNVLNIDFVKDEIFQMSPETVRIMIKGLKSVSKRQREDGLALLKIMEQMLRLAEAEASSDEFEGLFSQVLQILPTQIENVQSLVKDFTALDKLRKKTVIFSPEPRHPEL